MLPSVIDILYCISFHKNKNTQYYNKSDTKVYQIDKHRGCEKRNRFTSSFLIVLLI